MIASGLLEEADERPDPELDDERRRYYRATRWDAPCSQRKRRGWRRWSAARAKRVRAR
jgi:hypothetical protein